VPVKFLSDDWAQGLKAELNGNDAFRQAAVGKKATIVQVIAAPAGETRYWIRIDDGAIDMGLGEADGTVDATISESYETAVSLAKSEINPVTAFMTGKIKIDGNMGLLLGLQPVLAQLPPAMQRMDVEY
jgi:putative sterol carrier protein